MIEIKVIYKGVLTTVWVRLDLWYKSVRRPCTTVSVIIFLYFNSKANKRLAKKFHSMLRIDATPQKRWLGFDFKFKQFSIK